MRSRAVQAGSAGSIDPCWEQRENSKCVFAASRRQIGLSQQFGTPNDARVACLELIVNTTKPLPNTARPREWIDAHDP
jgi:hypothetical protein